MNKHAFEAIHRVANLGVSLDDAQSLRRIAMTLVQWFAEECGNSDNYKSWAIERDEATDKPYRVIYPYDGKSHRYAIPDREAGARKRLAAIMEKYPDLTYYVQTDPRGHSLFILTKAQVNGSDIEQVYSRGIALFK